MAAVQLQLPTPSSPSLASWEPRRRARPHPQRRPVIRYPRETLLGMAASGVFPPAVLRSVPEIFVAKRTCALRVASPITIASILNTPIAPILNTSIAPILNTSIAPILNTSIAPILNTSIAPILNTPIAPILNTPIAPILNTPIVVSALPSPLSPSSPLSVCTPASTGKVRKAETDEHRLHQRAKQIEYGKRTSGYMNYSNAIAKIHRGPSDPRTPDLTQKCSKRSWDGQVRKWRRQLHAFDASDSVAAQAESYSDEAEDVINTSLCNSTNSSANCSTVDMSVTPMTPLSTQLEQLSISGLTAAC